MRALIVERAIGDPVMRSALIPEDRRVGVVGIDVTSARAIAQLGLEIDLPFYRLRVCSRLEILGMTGTARTALSGGCVGRLLGIAAVALMAFQCRAVLAGILSSQMPEALQAPVRIGVARRTVASRDHMARRLADRAGIVVTARASGSQVRVVELHGAPGQSAVAGITLPGGRNVAAGHSGGMD